MIGSVRETTPNRGGLWSVGGQSTFFPTEVPWELKIRPRSVDSPASNRSEALPDEGWDVRFSSGEISDAAMHPHCSNWFWTLRISERISGYCWKDDSMSPIDLRIKGTCSLISSRTWSISLLQVLSVQRINVLFFSSKVMKALLIRLSRLLFMMALKYDIPVLREAVEIMSSKIPRSCWVSTITALSGMVIFSCWKMSEVSMSLAV